MIETGSEYQLLQHFEALPRDEKAKKYEEESNVTIVPSIDMSGVAIDGNKFDSFINALINLIVVIPVKYDLILIRQISSCTILNNGLFQGL